jgi:DNA modification methylase
MGTGSTGVAALQNSRKFIGIEVDEGYFKAAEGRLEA